ncbi:hypothetical protein D9M68_101740 [compost metagenome]
MLELLLLEREGRQRDLVERRKTFAACTRASSTPTSVHDNCVKACVLPRYFPDLTRGLPPPQRDQTVIETACNSSHVKCERTQKCFIFDITSMRVRKPSRWRIADTCSMTVFSERPRRRAISLLGSSSSMTISTAPWRWVSPSVVHEPGVQSLTVLLAAGIWPA